MLDLLLYSTMHCVDAEDMIRRIDANKSVDVIIRTEVIETCLLYTSPSPRDLSTSRMPSSA